MRSYISHHWSTRFGREIVDSDRRVCVLYIYYIYIYYTTCIVFHVYIWNPVKDFRTLCGGGDGNVSTTVSPMKVFPKKKTRQSCCTISMALAVQSTSWLNANLIMFTILENRGQIWDLVWMYTSLCMSVRYYIVICK